MARKALHPVTAGRESVVLRARDKGECHVPRLLVQEEGASIFGKGVSSTKCILHPVTAGRESVALRARDKGDCRFLRL